MRAVSATSAAASGSMQGTLMIAAYTVQLIDPEESGELMWLPFYCYALTLLPLDEHSELEATGQSSVGVACSFASPSPLGWFLQWRMMTKAAAIKYATVRMMK